MAKSQAAINLEDAEKTLELIQEVFDDWDDGGSRLIDAKDSLEQIGEAISDYFAEEEPSSPDEDDDDQDGSETLEDD